MALFSGKRVLVTGSSRGIGFAAAQRFAEEGAEVQVHGRSAVEDRPVGEPPPAERFGFWRCHGPRRPAITCGYGVDQVALEPEDAPDVRAAHTPGVFGNRVQHLLEVGR